MPALADVHEEKVSAGARFSSAEHVIHHAMNQLYFGAGGRAEHKEDGPGLNNPDTKSCLLSGYAEILRFYHPSRRLLPGTDVHRSKRERLTLVESCRQLRSGADPIVDARDGF